MTKCKIHGDNCPGDSGHFFIDMNHPDDMFGAQQMPTEEKKKIPPPVVKDDDVANDEIEGTDDTDDDTEDDVEGDDE